MTRVSLILSTALIAGCGSGRCVDDPQEFEFPVTGPATAAVHVVGSSPRSENLEWVDATWTGRATNQGTEPCRVALYRHEVEPTPDATPTLQLDDKAPEILDDGGVWAFETVLPPPRDGKTFVRELNQSEEILGQRFPFGDSLEEIDDPDAGELEVWLTVAACADPDVDLELTIVGEVCANVGRRIEGSVDAEQWWPEE